MPSLTAAEVAKHNSRDDAYIIIKNKVYNVTDFLDGHPGGAKILLSVAGKDATKPFEQFHVVDKVLKRFGEQFYIGDLASTLPVAGTRTGTPITKKAQRLFRPDGQHFGELLPYADPAWMQDWYSPYYKDSHFRLAKWADQVREEFLEPNIDKWYEMEEIPLEATRKWGTEYGMIAMEMPPSVYKYLPADFPRPAGLKPEEIDSFHHLVLGHVFRTSPGLSGGANIGLPPIINFGSEEMKKRVVPEVCRGDKLICLAITEPTGGSDVQNLQTSAKLSDDGKYFIVNGLKKWISGSFDAEYLTTAVRTGGPGAGGVSLLLIEKKFGGVKCRRLKTMGHHTTKTCLVEFDEVKVPVENLIGEYGKGFKYVMHNFNQERIMLVRGALGNARLAYEEALKYAHKRKTFGKLLIEHPVIRAKLGHMARQIEATQHFLEWACYQVDSFKDQAQMNERMGGVTAMLKVQTTQVLDFCAREARQILGGIAYTKGGQGGRVERIYREVPLFTIGGGSEEVMLDFAVRDSLKVARAMGAPLAI